ncbi:uncharacterized protein SCHCODRAFT_02705923 [Schizophyllum commune H4-8]|uniref:uncharacterized protein n=1 Tax=Schizophyllum commune (strain H4-8 / FGSC 9210) TaxID=578458 RepID=UPI0021603516|nr:uncharacterized protein SCHCODRAFT_02705923 [Schizophyllum commune H4-8]KAI5886321.1 hypothetical protein SCHCODRAFT_02705923 [Schizophyllum commune H4-8]
MDRAQEITRSLVEPSAPSLSAETALATQATAGGGHPAHIQRPDHTPGTVIALATSVYQPLATMLDIIGQTLGEAPLLRYDKGARPALVVDSGVSQAGERFCIALLFATFGGCDDMREIADPIRRWLIPARPAGGACDRWPPWANVPVHNLGREMEFVISLPVNVYHIGVQAWECEPYVYGGKELWVSRGVAEALSHLADCNADALCKEVQTCPEYWGMLEYFNVTKTWNPGRRQQTWGAALSYERPEGEEEDDLRPAEEGDLHPAEEGDLHPAEEDTFPASPTLVLISLDSPVTPHSRAPSGSRVPSNSSSRAPSGSSSRAQSGSSSRAPSGSRLPAYSSPLKSPEPRGLVLKDLAPHDVALRAHAAHDVALGEYASHGVALGAHAAHDVELGEIVEDEDDEDDVDILPAPFLVTPQKMESASSTLFESTASGRFDSTASRCFDSTASRRFDSTTSRRFDSTTSKRFDHAMEDDFPPTPSRAPARAPFSSPTKAPCSETRDMISSPTSSPFSSPTKAPFSSPTKAAYSPTRALYSPTRALYSPTRALYSPARDPYLPADVPQTPIRRNGRALNFTDIEDYEAADEYMTGNGFKPPGGFIAPSGFIVTDGFMNHFMATDDLMTPEGFTPTQDFTTTENFATTDRFMTADNLATTPATPSLLERISTARTPKRRARNRRRNDNDANTIPLTPEKGMNNPNGVPLTPRKPYTPHTPHSSKSSPYTPLKAPQLSARGQRAFQPYPQSSPSKAYPQFSPSKAYPQFSPSKAYPQSSPSTAAGRSLLDRLAVPLKDRLAGERKLADRISGAVVPSDD